MGKLEDLLAQAKKVHGNKYDYSKVNYCGWRKKVCIVCPEHGEFFQTLYNHSKGEGCPKCGKRSCASKLKSNTNEFVKKARKTHTIEYDYSKVEYVNNSTKVCVICPTHGEFWVNPGNFLRGTDCPHCKGKLKSTTDEFVEKAVAIHGNKYDYSKVNYVNNHTKVSIVCPVHGEFRQTPNKHLSAKNGCPYCSKNRKLEKTDFIKKAISVHGKKYDYSKADYVNERSELCIICPEHGEYWKKAIYHIQGCGCPKCRKTESLLEKEVRDMLVLENIEFISQYKTSWLRYKKPLSLDFYIPSLNVAIECQGEQHFKAIDFFGGEKKFEYRKKLDSIKEKKCKENNIRLLYFSDSKYSDNIITNKDELLKKMKYD